MAKFRVSFDPTMYLSLVTETQMYVRAESIFISFSRGLPFLDRRRHNSFNRDPGGDLDPGRRHFHCLLDRLMAKEADDNCSKGKKPSSVPK